MRSGSGAEIEALTRLALARLELTQLLHGRDPAARQLITPILVEAVASRGSRGCFSTLYVCLASSPLWGMRVKVEHISIEMYGKWAYVVHRKNVPQKYPTFLRALYEKAYLHTK